MTKIGIYHNIFTHRNKLFLTYQRRLKFVTGLTPLRDSTKSFMSDIMFFARNGVLRKQTSRLKSLTGLTLIELLVAITIFVLILSASFAALHQGAKVHKRLEKEVFALQEGWEVLDLIEQELRHLVFFLPPSLSGQGKTLEFFTWAEVPDMETLQKAQTLPREICKITYYLKKDRDKPTLHRRQSQYAGSEAAANDDEEILAETADLNFYYYGLRNGQLAWAEDWTENIALPLMLRVVINMQGKNIEKNILLPLGTRKVETKE